MKYRAFISYSHRDKAWGDWLHKALETYRVPKALVGQPTQREELVPARVYPVFRDREELPSAVDLGNVIRDALSESRYLIVVCSPHSAASQWVNEEILTFKRLGGEHRILAFIVAGEPNAADGKAGFQITDDCFPNALKFQLTPEGTLGTTRTEPIAADAREGKDGKANALLKLLAGLLGVNYDDLRQRDRLRRQRAQQIWLAVSLSLTLVFAGLAAFAFKQWREADKQRELATRQTKAARQQLARSYFLQGAARLREHDTRGLAYLAESLRIQPSENPALAVCLFTLGTQSWPLRAGSFGSASGSTESSPEVFLQGSSLRFARDDRGRHLMFKTPEILRREPRSTRMAVPPVGDPKLWNQPDQEIPGDAASAWRIESIPGGLYLKDGAGRVASARVFWDGEALAGAPVTSSSFAGKHWLASLKLRLLQYESFEKTLVQCSGLLWEWRDTRPVFQSQLVEKFDLAKARLPIPEQSWKRIIQVMKESNLEGDERTVQHLAISPNCKWVATCRRFSMLEVFDVATGEVVSVRERGPIIDTFHTVTWSADSNRLATVFGRLGESDGKLYIFAPSTDLGSGKLIWREMRDTGWSVGYDHVFTNQNGSLFYTEGSDGIRMFDSATGGETFAIHIPQQSVGYPGGTMIADLFIQECLNRRVAPQWLPVLARNMSGWRLNTQGLLEAVPFIEKAWPTIHEQVKNAPEQSPTWQWANRLLRSER